MRGWSGWGRGVCGVDGEDSVCVGRGGECVEWMGEDSVCGGGEECVEWMGEDSVCVGGGGECVCG